MAHEAVLQIYNLLLQLPQFPHDRPERDFMGNRVPEVSINTIYRNGAIQESSGKRELNQSMHKTCMPLLLSELMHKRGYKQQ